MQLSLRALRYFVAAADAGGVTPAAGAMRVSQPSISAAIAQLESQLGIQLFVRHHARGLTLTAAGERLLAEARSLLAHARELEAFAGNMGQAQRGDLSAGCFVTLAPFLMPGLIAAFNQHYPDVRIQTEEGNQAELFEQLRSGRCELAFSYAYGLTEEFEATVLAELAPQVIVSKQHALATRRSVRLHELENEPLILLDLPHTREYFQSLFQRANIKPRIAQRTRSYEMVRALAAHGLGFGVLNAIPRMPYTYEGQAVVAIPIADDLPGVQVVCLRLKRALTRPAVNLLADFAQDHVAKLWCATASRNTRRLKKK